MVTTPVSSVLNSFALTSKLQTRAADRSAPLATWRSADANPSFGSKSKRACSSGHDLDGVTVAESSTLARVFGSMWNCSTSTAKSNNLIFWEDTPKVHVAD